MQIPILSGVMCWDKYPICAKSTEMDSAGKPEDFYVYTHSRSDNGDVFYVGKGRLKRAFASHPKQRSARWTSMVKEAGGFNVSLIATCLSEADAFALEIETIAKMRALGRQLCNVSSGGKGIAGVPRTEEWRKKIGAAHRGKIVSDETRQKLSASVKASGYVISPEARAKIAETHRGHKRSLGYRHTDEWKHQASLSRKGNKSRLGQTRSAEERLKSSIALAGRKQETLICPHCFKEGGNAMKRWHFDKCRSAGHAA